MEAPAVLKRPGFTIHDAEGESAEEVCQAKESDMDEGIFLHFANLGR